MGTLLATMGGMAASRGKFHRQHWSVAIAKVGSQLAFWITDENTRGFMEVLIMISSLLGSLQPAYAATVPSTFIHQSLAATPSCGQGTLCFQLAQGVPSGLIAFVVACIAWHQYRVARAKLKLDLFDRRYEIFMATWAHLSSIAQNGPEPKGEKSKQFEILKTFRNNIPQAGFLFGSDIEIYLDEIDKKQVEAWGLRVKYDMSGLSQEEIVRKAELANWFIVEAHDAKRHFLPYLELRSWQ